MDNLLDQNYLKAFVHLVPYISIPENQYSLRFQYTSSNGVLHYLLDKISFLILQITIINCSLLSVKTEIYLNNKRTFLN